MTARLIALIAMIAAVAVLFGVAAEIARASARNRVSRGLAPGRDVGEVYRHAAPLFRLSRELAAVAALLFAAAAGVAVSLIGAP